MRFKVGDKVKIVSLCSDFEGIEFFLGKTGTILDVTGTIYPYIVDIPDYQRISNDTICLERELELVN